MSNHPKKILLVDDDPAFLERLTRALEKRGYEVLPAGCAAQARKEIEAGWVPDAATVDLRMPGESGLDLVRWLAAKFPGIRLLMLTGYGSVASAVRAMRLGACDYLAKPADADQIEQALFGEAISTVPEAETETASLGRVEWEHLQRVLMENEGSISAAARALGLERRSLQRKLQKYPPPK